MKKLLFLAITWSSLATVWAAAPPTERSKAKTVADSTDVLYLGPGRPVVIRFHLSHEKESVTARWNTWISRYFRYLDRNNNGSLDRIEASRVLNAAQLAQQFNGYQGYITPQVGQAAVTFEQLDKDHNGKVTSAELRAYYSQNNAGPVNVYGGMVNLQGNSNLTELLFRLLDADEDNKLSQQELRQAPRFMAVYDVNDDELISTNELLGTLPNQGRGQVNPRPGRVTPTSPATMSMMLLPGQDDPGASSARLDLARKIIAQQDRDRNRKLNQDEIGLPKSVFASLDRNRDGQLDVLEIRRWLEGKPDYKFTVRFRDTARAMMPARGQVGAGGAIPPPVQSGSEIAKLTLDNSELVIRSNPLTNRRVTSMGQYMLQQFRQIDKEKKGVITRGQIDQRQHYYLNNLFDLADRDQNGNLTEEELKVVLDLLSDAHGAQVTMTLAMIGEGLFQVLDTSGDNQLSARELLEAWSRLKGFDRDGDGYIVAAEFPRQLLLNIGVGMAYTFPQQPGGFARRPVQSSSTLLWFRKMDRNGDGDVSMREWLGTREEFENIDLDRDGLISSAEAQAADARLRKKSGQ